MLAAKGILTSRGGATSHAAVVARQFGIPAVVGCDGLEIDLDSRVVKAGDSILKEGDYVSLDGTTGEVFAPVRFRRFIPSMRNRLTSLRCWGGRMGSAQRMAFATSGRFTDPRLLQVWANADYPRDARRARSFGAKGIGLCRTEHMFFEEERLPIVQQMILADNQDDRQAALDALLPFQRADFEGLFEAMDGLPVIIRLIDPPLHEFLPSYEDLLVEVTQLKVDAERIRTEASRQLFETTLKAKETMLIAVEGMRKANPMMGLRGIRLGIVLPGLIEMQVRANFRGGMQSGVARHRCSSRDHDSPHRSCQRAKHRSADAGESGSCGDGGKGNQD